MNARITSTSTCRFGWLDVTWLFLGRFFAVKSSRDIQQRSPRIFLKQCALQHLCHVDRLPPGGLKYLLAAGESICLRDRSLLLLTFCS
jgi:hypothetical protein